MIKKNTKQRLFEMFQHLNESSYIPYETYYDTYSEAVQTARKRAEDMGFGIDEDDWYRYVNVGPGRPKNGGVSRSVVGLTVNGIPTKKALVIVVTDLERKIKPYELVTYIA